MKRIDTFKPRSEIYSDLTASTEMLERARGRLPIGGYVYTERPQAIVQRATVEWLAETRWTLFAHLTFRRRVSRDEAKGLLWNWLKRLARNLVHAHLQVLWAVEVGEQGRVHVHALISAPAGFSLESGEAGHLWKALDSRAGIYRINPYDSSRPGIAYVLKEGEWEHGVACSRNRSTCRHRCFQDPAAR